MRAGGNIEDTHLTYMVFTPKDPFTFLDNLQNAPGIIEANIGSPYAPGQVLPQVFGLRGSGGRPMLPTVATGVAMGVAAGIAWHLLSK